MMGVMMRSNRKGLLLTLAVLAMVAGLFLLAGMAQASPLTHTGNLDIGDMMNEAKGIWDFDEHDSILLLEGRRVTWTDDGRLRDQHHRVVWISTEHGIESYADLRIPYDSDRQTLTVKALRVWRDGRWIEHRPTAIVPTTPYAFRTAPDYTGIRETMLLHDGVELPCILECDYVIEDKELYRSGFDGQWSFQHNDPALNSWLIVEAPEATGLGGPLLVTTELNGAPAPSSELPGGNAEGQVVKSYRMTGMDAAPLPATNDPASYLPTVQWSSYPNWGMLGESIKGEFLSKLVLGDALQDSLVDVLDGAETMVERVHRVAEFVKSHQRMIGYDASWFYARPRTAERVYDTGYGVAFDTAVLTAALMREAGAEVWPVLLGKGYGDIDEGVATLARFQHPGVWVSGPGVEAYYDAAHGTLHNGLAPIYGRSIWLPGYDDAPTVRWTGDGQGSRLLNSFSLSWDGDGWTGEGYYEAGGGFSPFDKMEGGGNNSQTYLNGVVGKVLPGGSLDGFSPMSFDRFTVASDVTVSVAASDRDAMDRLPVTIATPKGGIIDDLPHDVHLYLTERGTPIRLAGTGEQQVQVTLNVAGMDIVHLPAATTIENEAGRFELTVEQMGDEITVRRYLGLNKSRFEASEWPALRELLLAEVDPANQTVYLK